ncbi:MAG: hypothetical protein SFW65_10505 [Alphaproteobacteria bacterium]|nr:hypothetical protein [Alphaproteobacteria bacterium]
MKSWTHPDPFTEMKMELCTGAGLAQQAEALSPRERKQIAAVCAAYHLGAYQLTGLDVYMDIFFTYGKKYRLTIQDIDAERWPNKTANTFFSEMQGIGYELVTLPAAEKEERLIAWRIIAQTYFKEAYKAGVEPKPAKLLKLVPKAIHIAR